jgi:hypothetical protein
MTAQNTPEELAAGAECRAMADAYAAKLGLPVLAGAVDAPAYLKDPHDD